MMTKSGLLCIFIASVSAVAQTPTSGRAPDTAEQSRALAAIRDYTLNYTARLPDFTCTQVTRRTFYPIADYREHRRFDYFEEQITFVDHKESYAVTKTNGEAVTAAGRDQLRGTLSKGEFGSLLSSIFDPKAGTDFRWDRSATQKGQRMYVFSFRVPQSSGYALVESKRTLIVAYKGLLYSDPRTGAVLRIEMQCDIPRDSEYKQLELAVDFKPTEVAGREFILPFHYHLHSQKEVLADATSKASVIPSGIAFLSETINEAHYKAYRRFSADSSVTFGSETNPKAVK